MRLTKLSESTPLFPHLDTAKWKHGVVWARLVTCATSIGEGYGLGIMSGAHKLIQEDIGLTDNETAMLVGVAYFAWAVGAPLGACVADAVGRVPGMVLSYLLMGSGAVMMSMSNDFRCLVCGRVVEASGIGVGVAVITTYMVEISPAKIRGQLPSLEWVFMIIGLVLGWISNRVFLGMANDWRWMVGLGSVLPYVCIVPILLGLVTESPRYLASKGRFQEAGMALKSFVHEEEWKTVVRLWEAPKQPCAGWADTLCPSSTARRTGLALSVMLLSLPAFTGQQVIVLYSTDVFVEQMSASSAMNLMILLGIARIAVSAYTISIIDKYGRRQLMIPSLLGLSLSCFVVAYTCSAHLAVMPWVFLAAVMFVLSLEIGYGPLSIVYSAELFDSQVRGKGVALCWFIGRASSGFVLTCFPSWSERFGMPLIFVCFGMVGMSSMLIFWQFAPETKGVYLEDITNVLEGTAHDRKDSDTANTSMLET